MLYEVITNGVGLVIYKFWRKISPWEKRSNWLVNIWKIAVTFGFITRITSYNVCYTKLLRKATVVLAQDYKEQAGDELVKELQNHVKEVTAPYKYPRQIEFVDELPKTISGKIRRYL